MEYVLSALVLCAVTSLWGAGLARLVWPRRWSGLWPAFAPVAGLALQSATVWIGAWGDLPGTDRYAVWTWLIPFGLLVTAGQRAGWRRMAREVRRWWAVGALMVGSMVVLALPLAWKTDALTSVSLGNCDAADYAAGARVFKEFAHSDRSGFLGLTEVVQVGSTDNFFDFWLRLNHFTPSALLALNSSWAGLEPYALTSVLTVMLLVAALPVVYLLARRLGGARRGPALWLTLIYALNPLTWYAAYQVAPAQLIAAAGIGWVTWLALAAWDWRRRRCVLCLALPLVVAFSLLWGAYNFIVIVCLVPAIAVVGGRVLVRGEWGAFARWLLGLIGALVSAGGFYFDRVTGLFERFQLFAETDFGWRIAPLMPEGWLGMVADSELNPWRGGLGYFLSMIVMLVLTAAWSRSLAKRQSQAWVVPAVVLPILLGYAFLHWRGWSQGTNASYDAYKLLAVFYPVILAALGFWVRWLTLDGWWRIVGWAMVGIVTVGNLEVVAAFSSRMALAPLKVDRQLAEIAEIEHRPEVSSLNLRMPQMWDRLWANQFLLRKPQYFPTHTYEGRRNTPLRGKWDLNGGLVQVRLPGADSIELNSRFSLARCDSPWHLRATWGRGWHGVETFHSRRKVRWNWSGPVGELLIENPQPWELRARLRLRVRSLESQQVGLAINGWPVDTIEVGETETEIFSAPLQFPLGNSILSLHAARSHRRGPGDPRSLGLAVYGVVLEVIPDDTPAS